MFNYEKLEIWKRSHALAVDIHRALPRASRNSLPGLRSQLLRASASISSNIAEASGQPSEMQAARFIDISLGSISETQNHIAMASATELITAADAERFTEELRQLRRMTIAFRKWVLAATS